MSKDNFITCGLTKINFVNTNDKICEIEQKYSVNRNKTLFCYRTKETLWKAKTVLDNSEKQKQLEGIEIKN